MLDKYNVANNERPILAGLLIKRNRYYMYQERNFELFKNGQLKYTNLTGEELGTLLLSKHTKVLKVGRNQAQLRIPGLKDYNLIGKELSKCPDKTKNYSWDIDDWVTAINAVCLLLPA